jgi:hypothetical protein
MASSRCGEGAAEDRFEFGCVKFLLLYAGFALNPQQERFH